MEFYRIILVLNVNENSHRAKKSRNQSSGTANSTVRIGYSGGMEIPDLKVPFSIFQSIHSQKTILQSLQLSQEKILPQKQDSNLGMLQSLRIQC